MCGCGDGSRMSSGWTQPTHARCASPVIVTKMSGRRAFSGQSSRRSCRRIRSAGCLEKTVSPGPWSPGRKRRWRATPLASDSFQ